MQRIYSAVDPYNNNIFKDYIDVKIEEVTERNLNRIFVKMDENTKEMLRMFEAMNNKIDYNAKEMNNKIDYNAKEMNINVDPTYKEINEKSTRSLRSWTVLTRNLELGN